MTTHENGTIKIRYYDRADRLIAVQHTTDPYAAPEIAAWDAWLNDPALDQYCRFREYAICCQQRRPDTHP
jgi:hypothetical protein